MQFYRLVGLVLIVPLALFFWTHRPVNGQPNVPTPSPRRKGRVLLGQLEGAGAISLSPDGHWLLAVGSASKNGEYWGDVARVWNTSTGKGHDISNQGCVVWTRDNRLISYAYTDPFISLFSPQHPKVRQIIGSKRFSLPDDWVQDIKVSPDGSQLWLLTAHQFFRFQISNRRLLGHLWWGEKTTARSAGGKEASLSPDGREILAQEKLITLYSTQSGKRLRRFPFLKKGDRASFNAAGDMDEVLADPPSNEETDHEDFASTVVTRRANDGSILSKRQDVNRGDHGGPYTQEDAAFTYTLDEDQIWKTAK